MSKDTSNTSTTCLCNALRTATRSVTRLYDDELRPIGLRTTQYSLLRHLCRAGEVRQRDLSGILMLDETTLTRNLRPLVASGWVTIEAGADRREKIVRITKAGNETLRSALPAWNRAQKRMQSLLAEGTWDSLLDTLSSVARLAADA